MAKESEHLLEHLMFCLHELGTVCRPNQASSMPLTSGPEAFRCRCFPPSDPLPQPDTCFGLSHHVLFVFQLQLLSAGE